MINYRARSRFSQYPQSIRFFWYALIATTIMLYVENIGVYQPRLSFSMLAQNTEAVQVFCDQGAGFREDISKIFTLSKENKNDRSIKIVLPGGCNKIRFDLGSSGSVVTILSARLKTSYGLEKDLLTNIQTGQMNEVHLSSLDKGSAKFISEGMDPYVILKGDFTTLTSVDSFSSVVKSLFLFLILFGFFWVVDYLAKGDRFLFTIMLVGVLLRIVFYFNSNLSNDADQLWAVWPDESTYYFYVSKLLDNGIVQYFNNAYSVEIAPGIVFYLATLLSVFDGNIAAIRIFNLLFLSSVVVFFTYKIAINVFSYRVAVAASLLVATNPVLIEYAPTLLTEYLFISFLLAYVFTVLKIADCQYSKKLFWMVIFGALAGLISSITRLVFLPVVVATLVYSAYFYWKKINVQPFIAMATLVFLLLIGLIPFFYNGFKHSGNFMIATGSGAVLWLGSRSDTEGDDPPYRHKTYDTNLITNGKYHLTLEGDALLKNAAIKNIAEDPINYAWLSIKKIGRLTVGNNYAWFFPYGNFAQWVMGQTFADIFIKLYSVIVSTFVAVFGFFYFLIHKKRSSHAVWLYLVAITLVVTYLPFMVNQRYGLSIFVIGSILAMQAAKQSWKTPGKCFFTSLVSLCILIVIYIISGI